MLQKPNLLPQAFRPQPLIHPRRLLVISLVLVSLYWGGMSSARFYLDLRDLETQKEDLQQALSQLTPTQEKLKMLLDAQQENERLRELTAAAKTGYRPWSLILSDITRVMPDGVVMETLTTNTTENSMLINGSAPNSLAVAGYATELRKYAWFTQVEIVRINKNEQGRAGFEIKARLEGGGPDEDKTAPAQSPS